jgi:anaerobic magnesium-protoporphyrin IX monomethyl ester cyclase
MGNSGPTGPILYDKFYILVSAEMANNKQVHLVNVAAEYRGVEDTTTPPSGCLYVGGALKKAGYNVCVHHIVSSDVEETVAKIVASDPLFVGFSVLTGSPVVSSARISRLLKKHHPNIPIVWGGVHPSLTPDSCLCEPSIDYVIRGEGEITVVELAEALSHSMVPSLERPIDGLSWKLQHGGFHHGNDRALSANIDEFGQDWSLVDPKRYIKTALDGSQYFCAITSRGCPYKCAFCYNYAFNKRRWRGHTPEHVLNELVAIRDVTGVTRITFNDDNFMVDEKRAFQILEGMQHIGMTAAWIEVRLDRFTDDLLGRLKKIGVKTIFVGWESGSDRTLQRISKGFNRDLVLNAFSLAAKNQMEIDASAIVGFPFESEKDWLSTIDTAVELDAINPGRNKFNVGVYVPYPGTPLVEEAIKSGFRFPTDIMEWDCFDILKGKMKLPWMAPDQIKKMAIVDRYAKMLYLGGGGSNFVMFGRRFFANLARRRLKDHRFTFPWEALLYDFFVKVYLGHRRRQNSAMQQISRQG